MAYSSKYPVGQFTFAAKQLASLASPSQPHAWNTLEIGIFHVPIFANHDENKEEIDWANAYQIGSYGYNYSSFQPELFCPFKRFGKWYALYSTHYTASRVMEIFRDEQDNWTWKDLCGEGPDTFGFCPTEFHIPFLYDFYSDDMEADPADEVSREEELAGADYGFGEGSTVRTYRPDYAFVSGCIWGDDTSWKIQFLDLSKIEEGILTREDRFGYIELPRRMKLAEAISADCSTYVCGYGKRVIKIAVSLHFDLNTGQVVDSGLKFPVKIQS